MNQIGIIALILLLGFTYDACQVHKMRSSAYAPKVKVITKAQARVIVEAAHGKSKVLGNRSAN